MTTPHYPARDPWALVDAEKRRDRLVRTACFAAWSVTFVLVLVFAVLTGVPVLNAYRLVTVGAAPWAAVIGAATPFLGALWTLSLIVATLATVGMFLRMRTASLTEIQLRLAALEEMIASRGGGDA